VKQSFLMCIMHLSEDLDPLNKSLNLEFFLIKKIMKYGQSKFLMSKILYFI